MRRVRAARDGQDPALDPEELLRALVEVEITPRDAGNTRQRSTQACSPKIKTVEQFDLAASSVAPQTWAYLASLEWIGAMENLTLIGPVGTGESQLSAGAVQRRETDLVADDQVVAEQLLRFVAAAPGREGPPPLGAFDPRVLTGLMTRLLERNTTLARYQIVNAVIWASTLMGVAVVAKTTDEFIYVLLVLVVGSTASWAAIWEMLVRGGAAATPGAG